MLISYNQLFFKRPHCNSPLSRGNLPRSGRDAGENLIADQLVPKLKEWPNRTRTALWVVNVTPALKNLGHPLYKIFGDIPAGSSLPAVRRRFHPRLSEALRHIVKKD